MFETVFEVVLMVVAIVLIILSLVQSGKSDGMSGAFSGGDSLNLFANVKERGPEKVLSNMTMVFGITFFVLVIMHNIIL